VARSAHSLRIALGVSALALFSLACSPNPPSSAWGSEAVSFFDDVTEEHATNDFYGVLDFYTPGAYIEIWRGDLRGGARVAELLRWNSGDLEREIQSVYLGTTEAVTTVRWLGNGQFGAVVSTLKHGLIDGETVYDLGESLELSLRATPETVSRYADLYALYAESWSTGDPDVIGDMYAADATVTDTLSELDATGPEQIALAASPGESVEPVGTNEMHEAVYLGPAEYGQDPGRALGVFQVADAGGCIHQLAVVWTLDSGRIAAESRYHEAASFPKCHTKTPRGWWSGLARPLPSDQVTTGFIRTPGGREVAVRNGTAILEDVLQNALLRFEAAGLSEPTFDSVVFEPSRSCAGRSGRVIQSEQGRDVFICLFESDLCPGTGPCQEPNLAVRGVVLHELAHAWILDNASADLQLEFVAHTQLAAWQDDTLPWAKQGVEYSADVLAWALLEEPAPMVRIGSPSCADLAAAYNLLTGLEAAHDCDS